MKIKQSEFIISAVKPAQFPTDQLPEVAFVGRSNVGKSSLINTLTNRKKLAKVSGTPGKTRLINFFLINNDIYFVDLPGYGYAKVSKKEQEGWGKMIESYLSGRDMLKKVVILVDSRHQPTSDDVMMYQWVQHYGYEIIVVGTKKDKLTRNELVKSDKIIKETFSMDKNEKIFYISSLKKEGMDELLERLSEGILTEAES